MSVEFWKKKLAAWLHDPAEKALVLMRDKVGHEHGSVAALREALGIEFKDFDKDADHWAAAADRPNWPEPSDEQYTRWANVRFVKQPILIHPLSGERIDLGTLQDVDAAMARYASGAHFAELIERDAEGRPDHRLTLLAFWRFGPEPALAAPHIGDLWRLLPADSRVPDHSIWSHLDIVSALAGARCGATGTDSPALLTMSFGPVQGFIAQARSTSDLWAGSHLLATLVWEGLKTVCEEIGPDTVLFPHLRGVAAVDRWLLDCVQDDTRKAAWRERFERIGAQWLKKETDANPLFAATLPNKFTAIVPGSRAAQLAQRVTDRVRQAALRLACEAAGRLFGAGPAEAHWRQQIEAQFAGFPETHWSVAAWPADFDDEGFAQPDMLIKALRAFYPPEVEAPGFFNEPLWQMLTGGERVERHGRKRSYQKVAVEGHDFFPPRPGLLYPAVHDLAERGLAAAKALRAFDPLPQSGYRCTLCGEREWLTDNRGQLDKHPTRERKEMDTAWNRAAGRHGIKAGEHLCGVCALKRLWPALFVDQVADALEGAKPDRFVVSTHTMALATPLARIIEDFDGSKQADIAALGAMLDRDKDAPVALPAAIASRLHRLDDASRDCIRRLPSYLDRLRETGEAPAPQLARLIGERSETYYALLLMDGDRMGAWMAGNEPEFQLSFADTWHPHVRVKVTDFVANNSLLGDYIKSPRPASPARHAAISKVLNDYSTFLARHVVENVFKGKLIYAGGDDVLAMLPAEDLLPAILLLRAVYSGQGEVGDLPGDISLNRLQLGRGFVRLNGHLMLTMGSHAGASIGAVVAHHQAPLAAVLRLLRDAEGNAKNFGRNAFCLRVLKRGGGEVGVTARFWETPTIEEVRARKSEPPAAPKLADTPAGFMLRLATALSDPQLV